MARWQADMNREAILAAIQEIALRNKGIAPGARQFEVETGVSPGFWRGKFWLTWGDAVREAGLSPKKWKISDDCLLMRRARRCGVVASKKRDNESYNCSIWNSLAPT